MMSTALSARMRWRVTASARSLLTRSFAISSICSRWVKKNATAPTMTVPRRIEKAQSACSPSPIPREDGPRERHYDRNAGEDGDQPR